MKHKELGLLCIGLLVFTICMNLVSALTITNQTISLSNSNPSGTVTITGNENFTISLPLPQSDSNKVTFTLSNLIMSIDGKTATITVSAQELSGVKFLNSYSTIFHLTATNASGVSTPFQITANYGNTEFCSEQTSSNVDITVDSINTKSGFGKDEDYWYPLDNVQIDFKVKYNGDDSKDQFQNGQLDWALYTKDGILVTDGNENIKDLKDGKSETITVSLQVNPNDLDTSTEDYILYVSATGKENYNDKTKTDKDICSSDSQDINIKMDDNFVILDKINFLPNPASCGSEVEITGDVWNIGVDDQDDVSVRVMIDDLKINQVIKIGSINSFDKENLDLKINIPKNAQEKSYPIKLWVYDSDNNVFQNSEDDSSKSELPLTISGSCSLGPQVTVSASLESGGNAGKPMTVKATITNTGDSLETFNLNVANYNSFASLATLDQNTITIGAGQSKDVLVTLNVNKNISGEQSFNIEVSSGGNKLVTQPVQVTIQPSTGLSGITGGIINQSNWYLWGIGALNVILVIIIIIVAIRIARS